MGSEPDAGCRSHIHGLRLRAALCLLPLLLSEASPATPSPWQNVNASLSGPPCSPHAAGVHCSPGTLHT